MATSVSGNRGANVILPMARIRVLSQVQQLEVSDEDVLRGYVDVECGTQVELRSNSRCRLAFHSSGTWFRFVRVYGLPRAIDFGPEGGGYVRPLERQRSATYKLSYRFELRPEAKPGLYRWPLSLRVDSDAEEAIPRFATGTMRVPPVLPT